jgi:nucleoside-diphosphate-sugar epimerase
VGLRVLLTGASSFTGSWIARTLAARGHEVVAPLPRPQSEYAGLRGERVALLADAAEVVYNAPVGSERLLSCIASQDHIDVLCIHHAVVGDYRSDEFDVSGAVRSATEGAFAITEAVAEKGATVAMLTRSVFEAGQGVSDDPRPIGLYAVAKSATVGVWGECVRRSQLARAEFTVTNPFGPYEEPRFVKYLAQTWAADRTPMLRAPYWVRDNIPAPLLAADYAASVERAVQGHSVRRVPSHMVASNLEYATRIADQFAPRWDRPCPVGVEAVLDVGEPHLRIGTDRVDWSDHDLDEPAFWDDYAAYYAIQLAEVPR